MLLLWLRQLRKKLFATPADSRSARRKRNRLAVEVLESREVLSTFTVTSPLGAEKRGREPLRQLA